MQGPTGLRDAILRHQDVFMLSFTESLMTYGLGRRVEDFDLPTVRAIVRDASKDDYKMSQFILGVVKSPAFQMGRLEAAETTTEAVARDRQDQDPKTSRPQDLKTSRPQDR
jgi:hypothetical protein